MGRTTTIASSAGRPRCSRAATLDLMGDEVVEVGEPMFETVYALWSWCDGPRDGVADFQGRPHVFASEWDDQADDFGDAFLLRPIDGPAPRARLPAGIDPLRLALLAAELLHRRPSLFWCY
jgi:hypothetical protein